MKRILLITLFALFMVGVSLGQKSAPKQQAKIQIPPSSTHVLDNGLTVVLMEYHRLPLIELQLTVRGGSSVDPDTLIGLAGMTTGLLKKGTAMRSATQLAEDIDFIGASLSAGSGLDRFTVFSEFLKKDIDAGMELFSEVILTPTFPQEEINRERSQRLATLEQYKEDPGTIVRLTFSRLIFENHPYGNQAIGTSSSLQRMTRDAILKFYKETFLPNNSILVAVGDFQRDEMLERIQRIFGGWSKGTPRTVPATNPSMHKGRKVFVVEKPDVTQTQIRIGNTGVGVNHPDWFAIQVANSILGNGFTSRLVEEIRVKRSLSYGAGSGFPSYLQGGMYLVSTFTKNPTTRETIDVALEEVKKFREKGATKEELSKAQNYLAGSFARELQAPENLAANLSDVVFFGFPNNYLETYVEKLKAVTLNDVKRVANQYFHHDDLIIVVVTNPKETQESLLGLGTITNLKLEDVIQ
jgi:zinc protease